MLTAYPSGVAAPTWLDLVNPTDAERASVETRYSLQLPTRAELSEIESSSRISEETGILYLSMPIVAHADALDQAPSPLGFVLSKDLLVTIRYTPLRSFEAAVAKLTKNGGRATSVETFATLIDEMVDMSADLLEGISAELDATSSDIFPKLRKGRRRLSSTSNDALRRVLIDVGNIGERLSRIRDNRLKTAQTDVLSRTDYETHLSNNVQFLLHAVLGLIDTKQNDIFTVLTVVSVVGTHNHTFGRLTKRVRYEELDYQ
jgi:magnesium transporter